MTETTLSDDSENQGSGDVYRLLDSQCGEGGHEAFWEYTMEHSQTPEEYMAGAAVFGEELRSLTAGNDRECRMQFETPEMKMGGHVEILVDSNLIEVFVNDGEYVISNAVYGIGNKIVSDRKVKLFTVE